MITKRRRKERPRGRGEGERILSLKEATASIQEKTSSKHPNRHKPEGIKKAVPPEKEEGASWR